MKVFLKQHQHLLLLIALFALYFLLLDSRPLNNPDESRYADIALEMLLSGNYLSPKFNDILFLDKPPLYYWLQALSFKLFGLNLSSIRLFPALFACLGTLAQYLTCKRFFKEDMAFLSSCLLMTSPLYFFIGLYANLDMEVAVWISFSLFSFILSTTYPAKSKQQSIALYGAHFCSALAFLTKGLIGVVFPIGIIGLWLLLTKNLRFLRQMKVIPGLLIIFAINAPWFYLMEKSHPGFLHFFFVEQHFTRFVGSKFNAHNPIYFYVALVLAGSFPWSAFSLQALFYKAKIAIKNHYILYFYIWFAFVLIFFSIPKSKLASYIIPALPPFSILIAHYLSHEAKNNRIIKQADWVAIIISGGLLIFALSGALFLKPLPVIGYTLSLIALTCLFIGTLSRLLRNHKQSLLVLIISSFLFSAFSCLSVPYWIENLASPSNYSTQKLITYIKQKPNIPIYAYETFYYDLPIWLKKPIYIVTNWKRNNIIQSDSWDGKFAFGANQAPSWPKYLVQPKQFWQQYKMHQSFWLITRKDNLKYFPEAKVIAKDKYNVLILC